MEKPRMCFEKGTPPDWFNGLLEAITEGFKPEISCGPLGYVWTPPTWQHNMWKLRVFPTSAEVLGGAQDGQIEYPGFQLELQGIIDEFQEYPEITWNVPSEWTGELDGPGVVLQGRVAGEDLLLGIFAEPPAAFAPTVVLDRITGETRLRSDQKDEEE
jgi:hypothetical protein